MHRRRLILAASSAALILGISGCGKQQTKSTEQNLEPVKPIMLTEKQTETESTEKQTETESETEEKEQNPKDVLVRGKRYRECSVPVKSERCRDTGRGWENHLQ